MLSLDVLLYTFILLTNTVQPDQESRQISAGVSVLSEIVESFHVQNGTMEVALRSLRKADFMRILIGFEKIAHRQGEQTESLSLSLSNATVKEILDRLCQQSRSYTYEIVDGAIIHVHPVRVQSDPPGLLDFRISDFSVQGKMLPAGAIVRVSELAPELASYLRQKQSEYYARRGISPGSPGANFQGNMDPEIAIHLQNMTVREILNATVLYSVQLRDQTPLNRLGGKIPPTSWMYEFIVDPTAQTGLGGTPLWVAF